MKAKVQDLARSLSSSVQAPVDTKVADCHPVSFDVLHKALDSLGSLISKEVKESQELCTAGILEIVGKQVAVVPSSTGDPLVPSGASTLAEPDVLCDPVDAPKQAEMLLTVGSIVRLQNLKAAGLNGALCKIVDCSCEDGRLGVFISQPVKKNIRVKKENIAFPVEGPASSTTEWCSSASSAGSRKGHGTLAASATQVGYS